MAEIGLNGIGFLRFLVQFFAALTGALALWGFVFNHLRREDIARAIFKIFRFTLVGFLVFWTATFLFYFTPETLAHEGIFISPIRDFIQNGFNANTWIVLFLLIFNSFFVFQKNFVSRKLSSFFLINFIAIFMILVLVVWKGFDGEQIFFSLHNIHSIFTLGTVLTVDILYLLSIRGNSERTRTIYKVFPAMSAVIWGGLAIDFLSVLPIFPAELALSPQFYFSQIVVAIIILNGAALSVRITDWLRRGIKNEFIHLSGAISFASWISITFVDFFELKLSLVALLSFYALLIILAFLGHRLLLNLLKRNTLHYEGRN